MENVPSGGFVLHKESSGRRRWMHGIDRKERASLWGRVLVACGSIRSQSFCCLSASLHAIATISVVFLPFLLLALLLA